MKKPNLGKDVNTVITETNLFKLLDEHLSQTGSKKTRQYMCPFHDPPEKRDSFRPCDDLTLYPERDTLEPKFWKCFKCGSEGNAIDFLMTYHGYTLTQAVDTLMRMNRGSA